MSIFGEETIPVSLSPEDGHDEETAVGTEGEEYADNDDLDNQEEQDEEIDGGDENDDQDDDTDGDDESPEEGHDSDLLAGKYRSADDLAQAYLNAQRKISQQAEELKQLRGQPQPADIPGQQPGQQQNDLNQVFLNNFMQDPLGTMRYIIAETTKQQVAPILQQREMDTLGRNINALAKEYRQVASEEGMGQLMGKVQEIAQEIGNPALANNPTPRILRLAAEEAFGSTKQALYNQAKKAGREEAEKARQKKQTALSAPKAAKKSPLSEQQKSEEEQTIEGIMAYARGGGLFG